MVYMKAFFPLSSFLTWTTTAASLVLVISTALALSASTSSADLSSSSSTTSSSTTPSTCDTTMTKFRSVRKVMERPSRHWVGDGFHVYPVFANAAFTQEMSPLLMFDYAEPKKFGAKVGPPRGVGQHPHRGFETVTVAFQGQVEHHDSTGNRGVIKEGDVQWMTAGRGIIHEEYHSKEFTREGGTFEMAQLWVNLPKKHKMVKPKYQGIKKEQIPEVTLPLGATDADAVMGTARIIAGELGSTTGVADTFSPVQMWDVLLPHVGAEIDLPFPAHHNCIVFVRRGSVSVLSGEDSDHKFKETTLNPQDVALMRLDGSNVLKLRVAQPDSSVLILGGEPLDEPIAAQGPFVMNTQDEIRQAIMDYQRGKMGR